MIDTTGDVMALSDHLRRTIISRGPIPFFNWMEAALYDEKGGYYSRKDLPRWGRSGDYRTAPERSPLFGATFARKFSSFYEEMGRPETLTIIEAGAGGGDFAHDVLQTLNQWFPEVFFATHYLIDERSRDSRERITERLTAFSDRVDFLHIAELRDPITNAIIFSNELLDSFPVHLAVPRNGFTRELYVGLSKEGSFTWVDGNLTKFAAAYFEKWPINVEEGQIAELNLEAIKWIEQAASVLDQGYVITVDYGGNPAPVASLPTSPSLRAFYKHQLVDDILARPGEQDITTTIDWPQLIKAGEAAGLRTVSHDRQDQFLLSAGLLDQLELMTRESATSADTFRLRSSVRDLILPGGMSESFQVLIQGVGMK